MAEASASKVLWKASSSRHDWRDGEPLRRLAEAAVRLGLIAPPAWIRPRPDAEREPRVAGTGGELVEAVAAAGRGGRVEITVGGDAPAPWELFWDLHPFSTDEGYVDGLNTVWLTFDRARVPGRRESDALRDAFLAVHRPEETEYAVLHPYAHWSRFADEHYSPPVTLNLMFKGVFWANFLGPGHLGEFDLARLADLSAALVRWVPEDGGDREGLFVIATPDLATADAPASEAELLRLTRQFAAALKPDSKWHL